MEMFKIMKEKDITETRLKNQDCRVVIQWQSISIYIMNKYVKNEVTFREILLPSLGSVSDYVMHI